MQVCVLGPLTIEADGRPVEIGGARLRSLLVRLAADAGSWVPVSRLVQSLWLEDPPADEVNALQSLVSRLRRALPRPDLVESGPAGYRLVVARHDVDALAFEGLIGQGRRTSTPQEALEVLGRALALWRGAPLAEVADAPYAQAWVERLERLRLTAIEERAAALLTEGSPAEPVAELEEVAAQHPLRERTHELLIRALAADGRQGEALAVYERLRRAMADELGLDPPTALQQLHTQVLRDDATLRQSSSIEVSAPRRTNLRVPLTTFVGREAELGQITEQLARARLVTLVGTGGAGKTRLVSEVAAGLSGGQGQGQDGVWMVELAPVNDPDDVPSTVLGSIGTIDSSQLEAALSGPQPGRNARARLVEALAPHRAVVVLDNCEHLIEACAELAGFLLARCPQLTVLATSREPLGIVGESIWPVRPLATQSADSPAVRLFTDRAALVRPGFTLTPENEPVVTEICRRLDGLPLAIELAAARLRTLGPEALASRLDNRFRLLTGGNRTAMPRHQTLRAVVAWSWELLTEQEQDLIERISVFAGGATAQSAAVVCGENEDEVADLLISLADKSLLVVAGQDTAQPRYRLLETIREYALERLSERGAVADMRRAHAKHFLELAEVADPLLRGAEQLTWIEMFRSERDNLLASLRFAIETEDADHAVRLAVATGWFWTMTGRHDEAGSWAEQALRVPGESPAGARLMVTVLSVLNDSLGTGGMPDPELVEDIHAQLAKVDVFGGHPLLTFVEPALAVIREDPEAAAAAVERNLRHPDPWARAMLILMNGILAENEGDFDTFANRVPQALAAFDEIGDRWGIGTASSQLAEIKRAHGELDDSLRLLDRVRTAMSELQARDDETMALIWAARLHQDKGDLVAARKVLAEADQLTAEGGSWMAQTLTTTGTAMLEAGEGNFAEARRLTEKALRSSTQAPRMIPQVRAMVLIDLIVYEISDGSPEAARPRLEEAVELGVASHDMPVLARVSVGAARYLLARGLPEQAASLLGVAARMRGHDGFLDPEIGPFSDQVRQALGPQQFTELFGRTRALGREAAIELLVQTAKDAAGPDSGPTASTIRN